MSLHGDFEIKRYNFNEKDLSGIAIDRYAKDTWPIVYILKDGDVRQAYVGETTDAISRLGSHLKNTDKNKLSAVYIISSDKFNKSATLDIEANLIKYLAGDGNYKLLNGNLGLANHNYFQKAEMYQPLFQSIWNNLRKIGIAKNSLSKIDNSDLFKYSPYKTLGREQKVSLVLIMDSLLDDKFQNIVIHGGAGTGKTILAIFLFKLLNTDIEEFNFSEFGEDDLKFIEKVKLLKNKYPQPKMALVIPMASFRNTIKKVFRNVKGLSGNMVVGPSDVVRNSYDLVLVDESHRLRRRVNLGTYFGVFDKVCAQLGLFKDSCSELDWILQKAAKAIFFYDENQSIKPSDTKKGDFDRLIKRSDTRVERLLSQFRVKGGTSYVRFVDDLLNCRLPTTSLAASFRNYELVLFESITDLQKEIKEREAEHGLARMVAGYSWPWVSKNDKSLSDITIEGIDLKWNGIADDWVNSENATNEIGCIHTTQGYDLNYAGIIFGKEISYNKERQEIIIFRENYHDKNGKQTIKDPEELKAFILNIYKTIMLRGIKGTYIYVCDSNLREYFRTFIASFTSNRNNNVLSDQEEEIIPYVNAVPLYNLSVAAGDFSPPQVVETHEWKRIPEHIKGSKDLFACNVVGESMNKIVPNGSICLFKRYSGGSRNGKIVLVELLDAQDADSGSNYTLKEYESVKTYEESGEWAHDIVILKPISYDSNFKPIKLHGDEITELRVIGEFQSVLN